MREKFGLWAGLRCDNKIAQLAREAVVLEAIGGEGLSMKEAATRICTDIGEEYRSRVNAVIQRAYTRGTLTRRKRTCSECADCRTVFEYAKKKTNLSEIQTTAV
jgi:hypothetical protein